MTQPQTLLSPPSTPVYPQGGATPTAGAGGNNGATSGPLDGTDPVQASTVLWSQQDFINGLAYLHALVAGPQNAAPAVQPGTQTAASGIRRVSTVASRAALISLGSSSNSNDVAIWDKILYQWIPSTMAPADDSTQSFVVTDVGVGTWVSCTNSLLAAPLMGETPLSLPWLDQTSSVIPVRFFPRTVSTPTDNVLVETDPTSGRINIGILPTVGVGVTPVGVAATDVNGHVSASTVPGIPTGQTGLVCRGACQIVGGGGVGAPAVVWTHGLGLVTGTTNLSVSNNLGTNDTLTISWVDQPPDENYMVVLTMIDTSVAGAVASLFGKIQASIAIEALETGPGPVDWNATSAQVLVSIFF